MQKDIDKSLEAMSDFIEVDRWVMNYPYGSYNQEMIEYINYQTFHLSHISYKVLYSMENHILFLYNNLTLHIKFY